MQKKSWPFLIIYSLILLLALELFSRILLSSGFFCRYLSSLHYSEHAAELLWFKNTQLLNKIKDLQGIIALSPTQYHKSRGWQLVPSLTIRRKTQFFQTNSQGIRGSQEYRYKKGPKRRVLVLGDSYTFGSELSNDETYCYYLQKLLPGMEIINFGNPGYDFGQIFLYFKEEGVRYKPDLVLFCFVPLDISRGPRRFTSYAKPRFVFSDRGKLILSDDKPLPVPETLCRKILWRCRFLDLLALSPNILNKSHTPYESETKLAYATLDELLKVIYRIKATPVFFYLPDVGQGTRLVSQQGLSQEEIVFLGYCKHKGLKHFSMSPVFTNELKKQKDLALKGHWGKEGQALIAKNIWAFFRKENIFR